MRTTTVRPHPDTGRALMRARRAERYAARDVLRALSSLERLRDCGWKAIGQGVAVRGGNGSSGLAGVARCGSTWACPVCNAKISEHRRSDMHRMMDRHRTDGGRFALLTLTMRHRKGQRLKTLWDGLSKAWRKVQAHRTWREIAKGHLTGYARVVEVTHGDNGWHVHLHVLLFVKPGLTSMPVVQWEQAIVERWADALTGLGFSADPKGQQLKTLHGDPTKGMSDYFAKVTYEIARGDLKSGRSGSRTPWQILRGLVDVETGELGATWDDDYALWGEWERASQGRRQWGFSKGLRAALDVEPEISDEDAADESPEGTDLALLDGPTWRRLRASRRDVLAVLDAAEDGVTTCRQALDRLGYGWTVPPPRPPRRS